MTTGVPVDERAADVSEQSGAEVLATRRNRRRGATRRMLVALLVLVLVIGGIVALTVAGARRPVVSTPTSTIPGPPPVTAVTAPAAAFLTRYVAPDGRVVRYDQGGDTVSEGQAYALLLALATGESDRFASVWHWEEANLQRPDGLFSYRWDDGRVTNLAPATDADLETAWALVRASSRFDTPAYGQAGIRVADSILSEETVTAGGRLELVAGPWARTAPYVVNPSYLCTEAMEALARATGDSRWTVLAGNSRDLVAQIQSGPSSPLPPDWASLTAGGVVSPAPAPGGSPANRVPDVASYGLDAQRTPVWMAADCTAAGSRLAAWAWLVQHGLADQGADIAYSLTGQVQLAATNGLGLVAAAAGADSAGDTATGSVLLADAVAGARGDNYYGDAWAALGNILLDSRLLGTCPSGTLPTAVGRATTSATVGTG
jgi:endoglucanase